MRRVVIVVLVVLVFWAYPAAATGPDRLDELEMRVLSVGEYVPEHNGAMAVIDYQGETGAYIVSLEDGSIVAGPLPLGKWKYENGRLLSCGGSGQIAILDATTLAETISVDMGFNTATGICTVIGNELFFATSFPNSIGALNLETQEIRTNLFDVSHAAVTMFSHPGHPDWLYFVEYTQARLYLLDVSEATPQVLASKSMQLNFYPFLNDAGDEIVAVGDTGVARYEASTLELITTFSTQGTLFERTRVPGDRVIGTRWNHILNRTELRLFDLRAGRTIAMHPLPASPRSMASGGEEVMLGFPLSVGAILDSTPTITLMEPATTEIGFEEQTTLQYWAKSNAVELAIGGIPVPFELVDSGIEFISPALPLGSHKIEIEFEDGSILPAHPGHALEVVNGPDRAALIIDIQAAPGSPTSLTRELSVECDGKGDDNKAVSEQVSVVPGMQIEYQPLVGSTCVVRDAYSQGDLPYPSFGPIVDGQILDFWVDEQPKLKIDQDGLEWGVVLSNTLNERPLWVGVYQTMNERSTQKIILDCPSGKSEAQVAFGSHHRFAVRGGFEGGSCVLRPEQAPYALATAIADIDPLVGRGSVFYNEPYILAPIRSNMAYFEVVDIYRHPLDDPSQFVIMLYRDLFGRPPDDAGLIYWGGRIDGGELSRSEVTRSFIDSSEFGGVAAPVSRLYQAYFKRMPDVDGLRFWMGRARSGHPLASISQFFAQSAEFEGRYGDTSDAEFVDLVYTNVLGRNPGTSGRQFWLARLRAGLSRGELMIGFSESPENMERTQPVTTVTAVYVSMLGRTPEPDGLEFWTGRVRDGMSLSTLIEALLHSPEYEQRFDISRVSLGAAGLQVEPPIPAGLFDGGLVSSTTS